MHKICINMPLHKLDFNKGKYAVICKHRQLYAQNIHSVCINMHKKCNKYAVICKRYAQICHYPNFTIAIFSTCKNCRIYAKTKMQKNCCAQNKHKICRICTVNLCNGVFCKYMLHSSLCSWLRPDVTVGPPAALGHWQGPGPWLAVWFHPSHDCEPEAALMVARMIIGSCDVCLPLTRMNTVTPSCQPER